LKHYGNIDSKYRFVIIAAKRAKELLKGAKPRLKTRSRNPIRIAQSEVKMGLVDYEILKAKKEELTDEDRVFLGEEAVGEFEEEPEAAEAAEEIEHEKPRGEEEEPELALSEDVESLDELEEEKEVEEEES
jgi:DNA-directed RNA polymerase subunit omega